MRILIKYPTRNRPVQFLKTLQEYYNKAKDNSLIDYLVSYDLDDKSMTPDVLAKAKSLGDNIKLFGGYSNSKIHACNRDMKPPYEWDIVLLISDDMEVQVDGWDEIIRNEMSQKYPDTDGCLWFYDGYQNRICTLSCIGRKYYERFEYMYHPSYKSLWCDNEFTDVAKELNKIAYIQNPIIKHMHPCWGGKMKMDELYKVNESFFQIDADNYRKRKALKFAK